MNVRSLGFRLAVWYFCTVTAIFSLAVTGYWFAVRAGLHDAMDRHLGYRVTGFQQYLEAAGADEEPRSPRGSRRSPGSASCTRPTMRRAR